MHPVDKIINPRREKQTVHRSPEPEVVKTKEYPSKKELLELAKSSCKKLGGFAEIGDGFVIVDTSKFKISDN